MSTQILYNSVKNQNDVLTIEKTKLRDMYSTDDQKVYYQANELYYVSYINTFLITIYYILALAAIYLLFKGNISNFSTSTKAFITLGFLSFPYIVGPIEFYVYSFLSYIYALINGNVYIKSNY